MSRKILTCLLLLALIATTCFGNPAAKTNRDIAATKDIRHRGLHPKSGKPEPNSNPRDRRALILLLPEEESLKEFEDEDTTHTSTKTKRCKTPTRRVKLSASATSKSHIHKPRETNGLRTIENIYNTHKEHASSRGPSVRIIPLRDTKAMLRSGLIPESTLSEGIGNREENLALLKILEDNLKPARQEEIGATNKRKQRAKPRTDDGRYVCYCREENEEDANSRKVLSQDSLLRQPLPEKKDKCGRKHVDTKLITTENALLGKASFLDIPENRFRPQAFPILYPNVPQIPRYPINVAEQVGASLPVGDSIANLPYLPVVYKMQPDLTVPNKVTGEAPVRINIPAPTDNGFILGQRTPLKIKPKKPCIKKKTEYETTSIPSGSNSEDSIIGKSHSEEETKEGEDSIESVEDSKAGTTESHWTTSEEEADFDECIKLYGREVCVISATPSLHPKQGTISLEDSKYDNSIENHSNEDYDSPTSEVITDSNEYNSNDNSAEDDRPDDIIAAKHDGSNEMHQVPDIDLGKGVNREHARNDNNLGNETPNDITAAKHDGSDDRYHEPEINLGKGVDREEALDYSDINVVTTSSFTSKTYENESGAGNVGPTSYDDFFITSSGFVSTNKPIAGSVDKDGTANPTPEIESESNTDEIFMINTESGLTLTTEANEVSKEEYPDTDVTGEGPRNENVGQAKTNNNEETSEITEIYEDTTLDENVGAPKTKNFEGATDSPEKNDSADESFTENPKVGRPMDGNVSVEDTTSFSLEVETTESQDEKIQVTASSDVPDENEDVVQTTQTSSSVNDEKNFANTDDTLDESMTKSNEENVETTENVVSVTNTETYEENTDSLTGLAPRIGNTEEDEAWKAALPFCDNTLLQNSIKTVINNFANNNPKSTKDVETVGAPHGSLLPEILEVPNLKGVLSVPQIEEMIVEKVKDLVSEVSGVSRSTFSSEWASRVIKNNLNHMMSVAKSKPSKKLPPMTVEEREFKDGVWQTHLATVSLISSNERTALSKIEKVKNNMRNLLENPSVGMQAAKHPIVQNMIVETVRNNHPIDETKIRGALDHLVGQMKDSDENEENMDDDKLITINTTVKPANNEEYYDDDGPDVVNNTDNNDDELIDDNKEPKVGISHKDTEDTNPIETEKSEGKSAMVTTEFFEKEVLQTTVSSSKKIVTESTTDTSVYKLPKEEEETNSPKYPKGFAPNDGTTSETNTNLQASENNEGKPPNPTETNFENSPYTTNNYDSLNLSNESQSKTPNGENLRDDEKVQDENVGQIVGDAPTKYYSPNDRILNYIKNHRTGAANVGSGAQQFEEVSGDSESSTSHTPQTSQIEYSEVNDETTTPNFNQQTENVETSDISDSSDNVGVTESVLRSSNTPIPQFTDADVLPTLEDKIEDQTEDTASFVGEPRANSHEFEIGSSTSRNQFSTGSQALGQTMSPQYLKTHEVTTTQLQKKVTKTTKYFQPLLSEKGIDETPFQRTGSVEEEQLDESTLVGAEQEASEDSLGSLSGEDYTYFGKIVQNRKNIPNNEVRNLQQSDLFFVGDGVRLPLEIRKQSDGSYALSISRKVCENMLRKECPCCVPRKGNVVRSLRRNTEPKENQKYSTTYKADRSLFRTIRPLRKTQERYVLKPVIINDRVKRDSINDSITITMPVEAFARKYNLSLDLEDMQVFRMYDKKGNSNRYINDKKTIDYSSTNSVPLHGTSKSEKFSSTGENEEMANNKDYYVIIDGKPKRIRYLDRDTKDSEELSIREGMKVYGHNEKDRVIDRIKYLKENQDQREPVQYRYQRNVHGNSGRRTEVAKSLLHWVKDLFLNVNLNDVSKRR